MNILLLRLANNFLRLARLEPSDLRGDSDFEPYNPEESEAFEQAKYLDEIDAPEPLRTNWSEESTEPASDELKEFVEKAFELYNKAEEFVDDAKEIVDFYNSEDKLYRYFMEMEAVSNSISKGDYSDERSKLSQFDDIKKYFDSIKNLLVDLNMLREKASTYKTFDMRVLAEDLQIIIAELSGIVKEFDELKDLHQEANDTD